MKNNIYVEICKRYVVVFFFFMQKTAYDIGFRLVGSEMYIRDSVSTRSSIALPLQNNSNQTQFKLYESYDLIDSIVNGNPDTISITYEIETVYLSRACGYINNYSIQTFSIASESERWMNNSEVLITQVTNENEIHVKVLH